MPFLWKEKKENVLIQKLVHATNKIENFEITLNGFAAFAPRVIYIQVNEQQSLRSLQGDLASFAKKELNLFNANRFDRPYHPHMTVAFRDLKKNIFPEAWKAFELQEFEESFTADSFHLLKHNGREWKSFKEIQFSNG